MELLKKYMQLVMSEESVSYLSCVNNSHVADAPTFTREEFEQLKKIESEIDDSEALRIEKLANES